MKVLEKKLVNSTHNIHVIDTLIDLAINKGIVFNSIDDIARYLKERHNISISTQELSNIDSVDIICEDKFINYKNYLGL